MKRCTQPLDVSDPMVLSSRCEATVMDQDNDLCYYHRKLAEGLLGPEHPRAYPERNRKLVA